MPLIPRFQAAICLAIFTGAAYFGYRIVGDATDIKVAPRDERPPTSKPWPWESRRQANQNQPEDIPLKTSNIFDTATPFSKTFPDLYSSFKDKPVDELGQDWDDSLEDSFAKYAPESHDLQIEASTDLGQNWDN